LIEFATIGDGTNVQVTLLEMLGETEVVAREFYTGAHQLNTSGIHMDARQLFLKLENHLPPPKIGGQFAAFHPYWKDHGWTVER
jgi:hypothetical protein